jgi:hypothetical protein
MKKATSMIEYAVMIGVIITVLLAIRGVMQRGMMYKYKETGDSIGYGRQYSGSFNLSGTRPQY